MWYFSSGRRRRTTFCTIRPGWRRPSCSRSDRNSSSVRRRPPSASRTATGRIVSRWMQPEAPGRSYAVRIIEATSWAFTSSSATKDSPNRSVPTSSCRRSCGIRFVIPNTVWNRGAKNKSVMIWQVIFTPFFILSNLANFEVEVQEVVNPGASGQWISVASAQSVPFWPQTRPDADKTLIFRVAGTRQHTLALSLANPAPILLQLNNAYGGLFIDFQVPSTSIYKSNKEQIKDFLHPLLNNHQKSLFLSSFLPFPPPLRKKEKIHSIIIYYYPSIQWLGIWIVGDHHHPALRGRARSGPSSQSELLGGGSLRAEGSVPPIGSGGGLLLRLADAQREPLPDVGLRQEPGVERRAEERHGLFRIHHCRNRHPLGVFLAQPAADSPLHGRSGAGHPAQLRHAHSAGGADGDGVAAQRCRIAHRQHPAEGNPLRQHHQLGNYLGNGADGSEPHLLPSHEHPRQPAAGRGLPAVLPVAGGRSGRGKPAGSWRRPHAGRLQGRKDLQTQREATAPLLPFRRRAALGKLLQPHTDPRPPQQDPGSKSIPGVHFHWCWPCCFILTRLTISWRIACSPWCLRRCLPLAAWPQNPSHTPSSRSASSSWWASAPRCPSSSISSSWCRSATSAWTCPSSTPSAASSSARATSSRSGSARRTSGSICRPPCKVPPTFHSFIIESSFQVHFKFISSSFQAHFKLISSSWKPVSIGQSIAGGIVINLNLELELLPNHRINYSRVSNSFLDAECHLWRMAAVIEQSYRFCWEAPIDCWLIMGHTLTDAFVIHSLSTRDSLAQRPYYVAAGMSGSGLLCGWLDCNFLLGLPCTWLVGRYRISLGSDGGSWLQLAAC